MSPPPALPVCPPVKIPYLRRRADRSPPLPTRHPLFQLSEPGDDENRDIEITMPQPRTKILKNINRKDIFYFPLYHKTEKNYICHRAFVRMKKHEDISITPDHSKFRHESGKSPDTDTATGLLHVQPAYWWAGMKCPTLQVLLHGDDVAACEVELTSSDVRIAGIVRPGNPRYLLLYLDLDGAAAQRFDILLRHAGKTRHVHYTLKARTIRGRHTFDAADVVYLLVPDRFAAGNSASGNGKEMLEATCGQGPDERHGGNIAGITAHLDYLADLGVTALWPTPLLENDMPACSYHGYAITDYYAVDPRLGTNEEYRHMVNEAHARGIKVLQDMVFNHCGNRNFLFTDRPANDWFSFNGRYVQTSHNISAMSDPYAAKEERKLAQDGWFVENMPDFNLRNPYVADYLVQNSIWWIEFAGIDGIRQDTYPYADPQTMAQWCARVEAEYPGFNIVGETWLNNNVGISYWQKGCPLSAGFKSGLPTVMDFPLMERMAPAVDELTDDWGAGLNRIYDYLSQDCVYADPMHLLTFLDNHDTSRFARNAAEAACPHRYRQALTLLLTLRGIPQLYYGDEIGMYADKADGDGMLRQNFPGGFPGDEADAFTPQGRTEEQNRQFDFARRLLRWRRANAAVARGAFKHFSVKDGVYVYSRSGGGHTATVLLNGTDKAVQVGLERYREVLPAAAAKDVVTGRTTDLSKTLSLGARDVIILDFNEQESYNTSDSKEKGS